MNNQVKSENEKSYKMDGGSDYLIVDSQNFIYIFCEVGRKLKRKKGKWVKVAKKE